MLECDTISEIPSFSDNPDNLNIIHVNILMNSFGYNNLINGVTRKTENTASCIDHLFIRCKDENYSKITPVILKRDLTDHYPILLNLKLKNKLTDTTQENKLYSKIDYALLSQTISTAKWDSVFSETNAETSTTNFIESFTNMIKSCTKEYKICNKKVKLKPWITEGLILSIRKRDQLKKLWSQNPNNIIMQNNYKQYRTILSNLIKKTKYQYYKNKLQSNKGDIKKTWDTIKEVTNEKTNKRDINIILNANGEMISDLGQIASEFNSYFCNIGHQLARNINPTDKNFKEKSETCSESCYLTPITANELIDLICSLKNNVKEFLSCLADDPVETFFLEVPLDMTLSLQEVRFQSLYLKILQKVLQYFHVKQKYHPELEQFPHFRVPVETTMCPGFFQTQSEIPSEVVHYLLFLFVDNLYQ
nr:unnamed protein product [Callosobruchus analis]